MKTPRKDVIIISPLQFVTDDNSIHSEITCTLGANSTISCRKCNWVKDGIYDINYCDCCAKRRYDREVQNILNQYLIRNPRSELARIENTNKYKLVGGEEFLKLKSFDLMLDSPVKIIHTLLLGFWKILATSLVKYFLTKPEQNKLERFLFGYPSKSFSRKLKSSLRLCGTYLGRDFKILIHKLPIALEALINQNQIIPTPGFLIVKKCLNRIGMLGSLLYMSKIEVGKSQYIISILQHYDELRKEAWEYDNNAMVKQQPRLKKTIFKTSKFLILYHIIDDIDCFGSALFFETEKGEQFKFICEAIFRSNQQSPSRDLAVSFSKRYMTRHILTGGYWYQSGAFVCASNNVVESAHYIRTTDRQFVDNNDETKRFVVGNTGIFRNASV